MSPTFFDHRTEFEDEVAQYLGRRIIDHKIIRRLTKVSFLGLLNPLADIPESYQYSRYDHTLAVAHLTLKVCNNLSIPDWERILLLLSALVHDLGHGPFSHSAELILMFQTGYHHSHQNAQRSFKVASLIRDCYSDLPNIIRESYQDVESLAKTVYDLAEGRHVINDEWRIFNTPLCPDTFDGDNRACHALNASERLNTYLKMVPLDPEQLINAVSSHGKPFVVGIEGANILKKFNEQRFKLYEKVFYSTRLKAAEAMFARAIEVVYPSLKKIGFTHLTDEDLIMNLQQESVSADLWTRIKERRLFVPLSSRQEHYARYRSALRSFPDVDDQGPNFTRAKQALETSLAEYFGIPPTQVILTSEMPLDWDQDKLNFEPGPDKKKLKANWGVTQGKRSYKNKKIEIYVPDEVL